jgi:uncharacterized repeat protein (TIGR03803 family)
VFKVDTNGNESVLYSFQGGADGFTPYSTPVADKSGNLYGTTVGGGSYGIGTVFKLDTTGTETVLLNFVGSNGNGPSSLLRDSAGNLYGAAATGGGGACTGGCGVVFKLDASNKGSVLYYFQGGTDGALPLASVIRDSSGNLYGTTLTAGAYGYGTVFKLDTQHKLTTLYSFKNGADGAGPACALLRDTSGNLYGTTEIGGGRGYGVVFKVDTNGVETVLHNFIGGTRDGQTPYAGLVTDPAGYLYGTTGYGGTSNAGVVFKVKR